MLCCFFTPTKNSLKASHKILFLFNAIKLLNLYYTRSKINASEKMKHYQYRNWQGLQGAQVSPENTDVLGKWKKPAEKTRFHRFRAA